MRGFFISFEGVEGAGKTTQIAAAQALLTQRGRSPVMLREPGGTGLGDNIRAMLLDPANRGMQPLAEFFLFCASRNQLVETVIRPTLEQGGVVICDRFTDSSAAYQGYARGLPLETIQSLNRTATGGIAPDLTVLLDLPVEVGLSRARARRGEAGEDDRFEAEQIDFHHRVRQGFLELARQEPERFRVIDANRDPALITDEIRSLIEDGLSRHPRT